jgi:hypothetical protein
MTLFGTSHIAAPEYKIECLISLPMGTASSFTSINVIVSTRDVHDFLTMNHGNGLVVLYK